MVTRERQRIEIAISIVAICIAVLAAGNTLGVTWEGAQRDVTGLVLVMIACAAVLLRARGAFVSWALCLIGVLAIPADHHSWLSATGLAQLAMLHLIAESGRRSSWLVAAATFAALWGAEIHTASSDLISGDTATAVIWTAGIAALGVAIRSRLDYAQAMEDRARLAAETRDAEIRGKVAEERLRIARELHDVLGHHVAVIRVHAGLARRTLTSSPDRAAAALTQTEQAAQAVLREMGGILRLLREDQTADATSGSPAPGLNELGALIETVRGAGLKVALTNQIEPDQVTELVAVTAYRIVQECLTNAQRYGSGTLDLDLVTNAGVMTIVAENPTAPGLRPVSSGYGLIGVRERVRAVGGCLEISSEKDTFRVSAVLPLDGADLATAN